MSFIKKYWWIIAVIVGYMYWDKIKAMLGKTTVQEPPAPEPTDTTTTTTSEQ